MNVTRITLCGLLACSALAADWSHWRGPYAQGSSPETDLPDSWSETGQNLLWKAPIGVRSAPLVYKDRVYAISRVGEGQATQERVVALELDTGKLLWEHRFNVFLTDIVAHRIGWANLAIDPETDYLYAHGIQGLMFCFDPTGAVLWQRSLSEELGRISGYGGRTYSPIIEGDLVIISSLTSSWGPHGKGQHRFFGMDKRTGEIRWLQGAGGKPMNTSYSVPVVVSHGNGRVLLAGLADGSVTAMRPQTGQVLWNVPMSQDAIMASVFDHNGCVYAVHGRTNVDTGKMGRMVCLEAMTGKERWRVEGLADHFATPAFHEGLIYAATNTGTLTCVEAESGKVLWKFDAGNEAKSSPVYADGKIYLGDVHGAWRILKVDREGCQLLHEIHLKRPDDAPDEVYASAAVAHGKVILSTLSQMFCLSTKPADFRSPPAVAKPASPINPGKTTTWQLQPAETWLAPDESVQFRVVGFDADGNQTTDRPEAVTFSQERLAGSITADGALTAGGDRIQAGAVMATVGDTPLQSRVRVFPSLPYKEDFEGLKLNVPPAGWITSKLKAVVSQHEGNKVLRKLANRPAPPFARLRCYMTPPMKAGYTVQADILGHPKKVNKRITLLPDMGLINSRYLLILTGTTERKRYLRLVSWAPVPRVISQVEFPWDADTWYTCKLKVSLADGDGLVQAKVWPQGEAEPATWSLELTDATPNSAGSPGLYAYAVGITAKSQGTEVLFDNVIIDR